MLKGETIPCPHPLQSIICWEMDSLELPIPWGYQKIRILDKRPRESTDLEEYIVLEPKNII